MWNFLLIFRPNLSPNLRLTGVFTNDTFYPDNPDDPLSLLALLALAESPKLADGKPRQFSRDIRLTDVLNHKWVDELVTYTLEFPAKQATLNSFRLYDVDGKKEVPFQLSAVVYHDEKQQFVKSAVIAFFVDELPANGTRSYTVLWDPGEFGSAAQPAAALEGYRPEGRNL